MKGARNTGITRVTKFITEDGKEHDTHQKAQSHRSKAKFVNWCRENIEFDKFNQIDVDKVAELIYNNWAVTHRKETKEC